MEPESSVPARKVRFAPKIPSRKPSKPVVPKAEVKEDVDVSQIKDLIRRVNEGAGRGRPKADKKSAPVQVAFGQGGASSFIKSYGPPKSKASRLQDGADASVPRAEKEYKDPWDQYSYYPITLPLRRPYSGNPGVQYHHPVPQHRMFSYCKWSDSILFSVFLDEEEFGEASAEINYDENYINPAKELGLLDYDEEQRMLFFQLPASLPLVKRSATAEANEIANNSKPSRAMGRSEKGCSLEELPPGFMGKLLVYKSGVIKLKLGETLYDVSPGSECVFAQDVLAVNTEEKYCCVVGELNKRAIVTPDLDSLLKDVADLC